MRWAARLSILCLLLVPFLLRFPEPAAVLDRARVSPILEFAVPCTAKVYDPAGGSGSGVVIRSRPRKGGDVETYVLTCYHVVDTVKPAFVDFYRFDGRRVVSAGVHRGYVWKWSKEQDLAVLRVTSPDQYTEAPLADLASLSALDRCYAVGCPLGYPLTVTEGHIQGIDEVVSGKNGWRVSSAVMFGNSGGGCWTEDGELFGLTAMIAVTDCLNPFG